MLRDEESVVQQLLDAANKGDLTRFRASFTADGVVDDWGREFQGPTAIQSWSDAEFIGKWLLAQAANWLELGDVTRLLSYAGPGDDAEAEFLSSAGFRVLTRTIRGLNLTRS